MSILTDLALARRAGRPRGIASICGSVDMATTLSLAVREVLDDYAAAIKPA